ncbi:MAG: SPOR domain-containing protein [Alphaproteobacteria bacterium]|nr:MAG: SPOR domain-containing protein [Alphaproteobacteria bacterium]
MLLLSGCGAAEKLVEGTGPEPAVSETPRPDPVTRPSAALYVENTETDVEAPAVFENSGAAVWDGRPTLGGVWVAHPLADRPERVLISNTENGRQVKGALFRRDEALGGPAIQLSSDTARALGIKPGVVTPLHIVALRRTVVKPEPVAEPAPALAENRTAPVKDSKADASLAAATLQTPPAAAAESETPPVATAEAAPEPDAARPTESTPTETTEVATAPADAVAEVPPAGETERVAEKPETGDDTAAADAPARDEPSGPVERAVARALAEQAHLAAAIAEADLGDLGTPVPVVATGDIEAVDPVVPPVTAGTAPRNAPLPRPRGTRLPGARKPPEPAAPDTSSEDSRRPADPLRPASAGAEKPASPAAENTVAAASAVPAPVPAPAKRYVRVGIFGVAKNAENLRRQLEAQGYKVLKVEHRARNGVYSHVLVGPAADETELRRLLADMRRLGFRDALPVTG